MQNALLPDTFENARLVLDAMRPVTPRDGYSARVVLDENDPYASSIRRVLNAASTIGAVRHVDGREEVYEVRAELFEFLSVVAKKAFGVERRERSAGRASQSPLGVATATCWRSCRHRAAALPPYMEQHGFSAEVYLGELPADDAFVVRKVLNAGGTLNYVQLAEKSDRGQHYFVHKQLYKTLLLISSMAPRTGQRSGAPPDCGPGPAGHRTRGQARRANAVNWKQWLGFARLPDLTSSGDTQKAFVSRRAASDARQYFIDHINQIARDPARSLCRYRR